LWRADDSAERLAWAVLGVCRLPEVQRHAADARFRKGYDRRQRMTKSAHLASFILAASVALATAVIPPPVSAQAIYRCEKDGKVTYTDAPCEKPLIQQIGGAPATSPPAAQTVIGGGYTNAYGPWCGQAQFQIMNANVLQSEGTPVRGHPFHGLHEDH